MRDRRLLLLGVIAARGIADVWRVQARAALRNGELTPDELRETLVMLAPYAGYPCVAQLIVACEEIIGDWQREQAAGEPSLPRHARLHQRPRLLPPPEGSCPAIGMPTTQSVTAAHVPGAEWFHSGSGHWKTEDPREQLRCELVDRADGDVHELATGSKKPVSPVGR